MKLVESIRPCHDHVLKTTKKKFENPAIEYRNVLTLSWLLARSKSFFSLYFASLTPELLQEESNHTFYLPTKDQTACLFLTI